MCQKILFFGRKLQIFHRNFLEISSSGHMGYFYQGNRIKVWMFSIKTENPIPDRNMKCFEI